jgi:8-oxo-dGTP pyrophosphatase MutT (NUDIX family)
VSDYVASIRARTGHDLLFLQAASVLAFDEAGRVLLGRGAQGLWATIGGSIEPGETPADAAVREFFEEAGALVSIERVLGVFGGPEFFGTYPNGDRIAWTSIAFEARIVSGELKPDRIELEALTWFPPAAIAALPMSPANRIVALGALVGRATPAYQPPTWRPGA